MTARISARARDDLDYIFACICARQGIMEQGLEEPDLSQEG
jgi:hypothetical protein